MKKMLTILFALTPILVFAQIETPTAQSVLAPPQIWEPEGLNLPGAWNSYTNPPATGSALGSLTQVSGQVTLKTTGTRRYSTTIKVAASGGDVTGGTYEFLFTSGPTGSPWNNKWTGTNVSMNTIQTYTFGADPNNSITVVDDKWYTMNWKDIGYTNTEAIFMETTGDPVTISSVSVPAETPTPDDAVSITVTLSGSKSAEEKVYIRYTADGWFSSDAVLASVTGASATAIIPAQVEGTVVSYYALTTTVSTPWSDADMITIKSNTNSGSNYSYTVGPPTQGSVTNVTYSAPTTLTGDLTVTGTLTIGATVNTGSNGIDLGTTGSISGETPATYIVGTVQGLADINAAPVLNFGGLGISVDPAAFNLGNTTILRESGPGAGIGTSINQSWTITPTNQPGGNPVDVDFSWPASNDNGINLGDLYVLKSNDGGLTWVIVPGAVFNTGTDPRTVSFTVTSFSEFTIGDGDTPLPIELLSWSATPGNNKVTLNWETASELNHAGFEIYRSAREKSDFRLVASYTSKSELRGKGDQGGKYSLTDPQVINSVTYYYKLVDVSIDGNRTEHKVLSVIPTDGKPQQPDYEPPVEFQISSIYPNPFNPEAKMLFDIPKDGYVSIRLFNVIGQEVKVLKNEFMKKGRDYVQNITTDGIPSGVYMIVTEFEGQRLTKKLTFLK
ncbi:MAG: T9SS type A sorting domain-containing protein [Bacteroidetes bacterium]|nr:T9SS type A sorting domain-containing protein [Bacteroidota bacterium]